MRLDKVCCIALTAVMLLAGVTACGGLKPPASQEASPQPTALAPTQALQAAPKTTPLPTPTPSKQQPTAVPPTATPTEQPAAEENLEEVVSPELSEKIKSYRQDTQWLNVEGEDRTEFSVNIEWVKEGPARRMVMSGYDKDGKHFEWEIIEIADAQYMRMGDQWMSLSGGQEPPTGEEMLIWTNPDTWKNEPACSYKGQETYEGQKTKRWSCTKEVFAGADVIPNGTIEEGRVDSWVSEEYDIPVHTVVEWQGKDADGKNYAFRLEAKVYDINKPITIEPPEASALPGLPEDIPMMEGAKEVFAMGQMVSFKVEASVDEATAFYTKAMANNGWKAGEASGVPGMMTFTKEKRQVQIMISEEDAKTVSVTFMLQGE